MTPIKAMSLSISSISKLIACSTPANPAIDAAYKNGLPIKTKSAPSESAFITSVPLRKPLSTNNLQSWFI